MKRAGLMGLLLAGAILVSAGGLRAQDERPAAPGGEGRLLPPHPPQAENPIAPVEEEPGLPAPDVRVGRPVRPAKAAQGQSEAADLIVVGKVLSAKTQAVGMSMPPLYSMRLTLQVGEVLRGSAEKGQEITVAYQVRQEDEPVFDAGADHLVFVRSDPRSGQLTALEVTPATAGAVKEARQRAALPVGWTLVDGKPRSPWTEAWLKEAAVPQGLAVCGKTGRPALLAGKGVTLTVESVPPVKEIEWTNPDGDGQYKITVTNTTDKPVDVPALLSDDAGIRWNESLLVLCQGKAQPASQAAPFKAAPKATRLAPGQSVTTGVNALALQGIEWPRGGYRIEFTFCLGELAVTKSFYYMSRHHDTLRSKVGNPTPVGDAPKDAEKEGQEGQPAPRKSLAVLKAEARDSLAAAEKAVNEGNQAEALVQLLKAREALNGITAWDDLRRKLREGMEMQSLSAPAGSAAPEADAPPDAEKKAEPKETLATVVDRALAAVAAAAKAVTEDKKEEALAQIANAKKAVGEMDAVRENSDNQKRPPRRTPVDITPN